MKESGKPETDDSGPGSPKGQPLYIRDDSAPTPASAAESSPDQAHSLSRRSPHPPVPTPEHVADSGWSVHSFFPTLIEYTSIFTVSPFLTAFCAELGKRFGGTASEWISRIRLRRREGASSPTELTIQTDSAMTVLEIGDYLTDEAKLAMLDLDIEDTAIRGHRLAWNQKKGAWLPVDADH